VFVHLFCFPYYYYYFASSAQRFSSRGPLLVAFLLAQENSRLPEAFDHLLAESLVGVQ
jgi:hypothetical protein